MNDEKKYIDEKGIQWFRVWSQAPNAGIDSISIDPFDDKKNLEKIKNTKGSIGDMMDYSKEQSDRRTEKLGKTDPKKQEFYDRYASERGGKRHINEKREKLQEIVKNVTFDWSKRNR